MVLNPYRPKDIKGATQMLQNFSKTGFLNQNELKQLNKNQPLVHKPRSYITCIPGTKRASFYFSRSWTSTAEHVAPDSCTIQ